ncbi:MAG TPA: 6,7-dimethyl-8-ribityllumazine synthase [Polyangiaceae bacterium]|jgi:6,7-dimethyl-8-ribityllumazine synthase|nr:6,7-dimethyl-8-ribityllumazine synthase [Polyangiaceae bacterium]
MTARTIEGNLVVPKGARFAVVASRFNHLVVDRLVEGAVDALTRHGALPQNVVVVRVPGAWELPLVVRRLAATEKLDAIVALGAVIRGNTPHFDYVAGEAVKGLGAASHASSVPIAFGVLTTETIEQAIERAGTKQGNKGWDAAVSAIEMVSLSRALDDAGL